MSSAINAAASFSLQIPAGPAVSASWGVTADAYDCITATLPADGADHKYDVTSVPGSSVQMLAVSASSYDAKLLCKTLFGTDVPLLGPIVLTDPHLISTLTKDAPAHVAFNNGTTGEITVRVIALRKG